MTLRGDPYAIEHMPTPPDSPTGYFGRIFTIDDEPDFFAVRLTQSAAEESLTAYPLIVPTLTRAELAHLVVGGEPTDEIVKKAKSHAHMRLALGKSPFAAPEEYRELPH